MRQFLDSWSFRRRGTKSFILKAFILRGCGWLSQLRHEPHSEQWKKKQEKRPAPPTPQHLPAERPEKDPRLFPFGCSYLVD